MDLTVVSLLAALAGLAVQGIAIAEALARLRRHRRGRLGHHSCVVIRGGDGGGGSEVHLVITRVAEPGERPS